MKRIIDDLQQRMEFELSQLKLNPKSIEHSKRAEEYQIAISILSGTNFTVRNWMFSEIYEYNTYTQAKEKFIEIKNETENEECDIQLYLVIDDYCNVN